MPNLKVLYLQNNPVTKKIKNYRKTIISAIPTLTYLDDRPVFKDDRRHAEAFTRGGVEEERKERERCKQEERERHDRNHNAFKAMMAAAREEKRLAEEKARKERGDPEPAEVKKSDDEKYEEKLDKIEKKCKKGEVIINTWEESERMGQPGATVEEIKSDSEDEDEAPPELEEITAEELKKEWEGMTEKEKEEQRNQKRISEGLKDA